MIILLVGLLIIEAWGNLRYLKEKECRQIDVHVNQKKHRYHQERTVSNLEIGKYYYVVTRNNQMATGSVVSLYADWEVIEKTIETTTDITKVRLYEDYDDALNFAEQYNLEVKKVRTDILGLGSR